VSDHTHAQRVVIATVDDPLVLRGGGRLDHVEVVYETWGSLNAARDNAVFVAHALTGDAHAAAHTEDDRRGWWHRMVGPGKPVDTDRFFVICPNLLGGCRGTTGPLSIDPATGSPYGMDFPLLHMADLVEAHRRLLRHLGVPRLYAGVGGSLGGMQILQWMLDAPDIMDKAVLVAASARLSAENIAFSSVGRQAILRDPDFHDGRYFEHDTRPAHGLAVARMMAHITYVSPDSLATKFGHERDTTGVEMRMEPDYAVEHYLDHQGSTFLDRFDALTYLYLSRLLDYFDPFSEPSADAAIRAIRTRVQVTSFDSDWRFDATQGRRLAERLREDGVEVDFTVVASPYGHDSFLLDPPGYLDRVRAFLSPAG